MPRPRWTLNLWGHWTKVVDLDFGTTRPGKSKSMIFGGTRLQTWAPEKTGTSKTPRNAACRSSTSKLKDPMRAEAAGTGCKSRLLSAPVPQTKLFHDDLADLAGQTRSLTPNTKAGQKFLSGVSSRAKNESSRSNNLGRKSQVLKLPKENSNHSSSSLWNVYLTSCRLVNVVASFLLLVVVAVEIQRLAPLFERPIQCGLHSRSLNPEVPECFPWI